MQILAVIDREEVIFVDSQAYAVQDGAGGRLICLAWAFRPETTRDSLSEPAPIELIYYREDARRLHSRLVGEFQRALASWAAARGGGGSGNHAATVVPFKR